MPKISIIIVSFNTSSLLLNCLAALYKAIQFAHLTDKSEVIVVDNASYDGSSQKVAERFPFVSLIQNKENAGFAKANNQGIRYAKGEYVFLLNSDTEITKDALAHLLTSAESQENLGAIGARLLNFDETFQPSLGFFPHLAKIFFWMSFIDDIPFLLPIIKPYHVESGKFYEKFQEVDWVSGACVLVTRAAIQKVGVLDENIFMYGEEVEWCYRMKKAHFRILYTPTALVFHKKGSSGEGKHAGIGEEFSSLEYFYSKHKSGWERHILKILLIGGALLRIIVFGIIMRNPKKATVYAKAIQLVR